MCKIKLNPISLICAGLTLFAAGLCSSGAIGQTAANVIVNTGTKLGPISSAAYGVNTAVFDGLLLDNTIPGQVKAAGITAMRFPGGSMADGYHWENGGSISHGLNWYMNSDDTFDAFMGVAKNSGASPIITVNYGSNSAGNGPGDPTEAANWVAYANKTQNYGIKYWEIGNEVYYNGIYGVNSEVDLHSSHTPATYGANCVTYINAMKAKDSTIKCGVCLVPPTGTYPDGQNPDWNSGVLKACGSSIDFVIIHWYPQEPGAESDAGLLATSLTIPNVVAKLRTLINQYCGSRASSVQILITETNSVSYNPGKQTVGLVNALFLADDLATWTEQGASSVSWWILHNGITTGTNDSASLYGSAKYGDYGLLSSGEAESGQSEPSADQPFPVYYGMSMLSKIGKSGDTFISATSSQSLISAHAVAQAAGGLGVLLVNKDKTNSYKVTITTVGFTPAATAITYTYGESNSSISTGSVALSGSAFTVTVAPYSLTVLVASPLAISGLSVSPTTVTGGSSAAGTVTLNGPAPTGGQAVTVASSSSVASPPASVNILAGSSSGTFSITTTPVASSIAANLTASKTGSSATSTLTVAPPALSGVSLNPTTVVSGATSTGTVTLSGPAPTGGWKVTLASNSASATVPVSVLVPANSTSATFSVATVGVSASTAVTITASVSTTSKTATLTITPGALTQLSFAPASLSGGGVTTLTITLTGMAPAAGTVVSLASNQSSLAPVPSTVKVPAGATTTTVKITTGKVTASTPATVTGTLSGVTKSAVVTITK